MTEEIKRVCLSGSRKYFTFITMTLLCVALVSYVALGATGITFSGFTPYSSSITGNNTPPINVNATVTEGSISPTDVTMTLNGTLVTPSIAVSGFKQYKISYTPTEKLADGEQNVNVDVKDTTTGTMQNSNWKFTVDAVPNASNWEPAKGGVTLESNVPISLYISDLTNNINPSSLNITIDGNPITGTFKPYSSYIKSQGTISATATGLGDGIHNIVVSIADITGNVMTEAWSFTVKAPPTVTPILPPSSATSANRLSAQITDNTAVDWNSVKLQIDYKDVPFTVDAANNTVYYDKVFTDQTYTIWLSVKDTAGNTSNKYWSFTIDSKPPIPNIVLFNDNNPTPTITNGKLKIYCRLIDEVDIKNNVTLSLNGSSLPIKLTTNHTVAIAEAIVTYENILLDGDYKLELYAEDVLGNKQIYTWNFKALAAMVFKNPSPTGYGISDFTPLISLNFQKPNNTFTKDSIVMKLDGNTVAHTYDPILNLVSYQPTTPLANESYHTVDITITDTSGKVENYSWKFYTNTYEDMADSNINNCTTCHPLQYNTGKPYEDIHRNKLGFAGSHTANSCAKCHNYITYPGECYQCHTPYSPHGSIPTIKYSPQNSVPNFPIRVLNNRELWDCIICHQPGAGTLGAVSPSTNETRPLNNHDIPEIHKTSTTGCTECHAQSLTREHARADRVDTNNQPITCNTCHTSTNDNVKNAITTGNTSCFACHENTANHEALHNTNFNQNCTNECHNLTPSVPVHNSNLSIEHKNRGLNCSTCHNSQDPAVKNAIKWGLNSCSSCHQSGHGLTLASKSPQDVPLFTTTSDPTKPIWSSPKELTFWKGESWVPSDMTNGYQVISKRYTTLVPEEVYSYYTTNLQTAGWEKVSGDTAANTKFELVYTKGEKKIIIRCYDTERYNTTVSLTSGYKLEILYK